VTLAGGYDPSVLRVYWRDTAHNRYPVSVWTSLQVTGDKYLTGSATLTAPWSAAWVVAYFAAASTPGDPLGLGLEVYYRSSTAPLFFGAPIKTTFRWSRERNQGEVTILFEHIFQHVWRRSLAQSSGNTGFKSSTASQKADILGQRLMNDGLGLTYTNGGMEAGAPPYSGLGVDRGGAQQFSPWTIAVPAIHGAALSATDIKLDIQDGANRLDLLLDMAERGGIAYTMAESPAGTWTFDTTGAYLRTNLAGSVVLSERRGNILDYTYDRDYTQAANTWVLRGDAAAGSQIKKWYQDGTAGVNGIWEDGATIPYQPNTAALDEWNALMAALFATARVAVDVSILEAAGTLARFNQDFGIRDTIGLQLATFGVSAEASVVGYALDLPPTGESKVRLVLVAPPHRLGQIARMAQVLPGGRHGGGIFSQRDG